MMKRLILSISLITFKAVKRIINIQSYNLARLTTSWLVDRFFYTLFEGQFLFVFVDTASDRGFRSFKEFVAGVHL